MKRLLTAEETRTKYPVGTVVRFSGYEDHVGSTFHNRCLLEVVGHSTDCAEDGLLVRRYYRGGRRKGRKIDLIFATEISYEVTP